MTAAEVIDSMLDRLSGGKGATPKPFEISQELILQALRERDELLAALKALMALPTENPIRLSLEDRKKMWAAYEMARAAIAKAEGAAP